MVLVYRVLIGGGGAMGEPGRHLDWQVLRAPQYVNPAPSVYITRSLTGHAQHHVTVLLVEYDNTTD